MLLLQNPTTPNSSAQRWLSRSSLPSVQPYSTSTSIHHIIRIPSSRLRKPTRAPLFEVYPLLMSSGTPRLGSPMDSGTDLAQKWAFRLERRTQEDPLGWRDCVSTSGFCGVSARREALSVNSDQIRARSSTLINNLAKSRRSESSDGCPIAQSACVHNPVVRTKISIHKLSG